MPDENQDLETEIPSDPGELASLLAERMQGKNQEVTPEVEEDPVDEPEVDTKETSEVEDTQEVEAEEESNFEADSEGNFDPTQYHYEVKVDGKAHDVPFKELIDGYQRNKDYTQKTQAIAEQRKELSKSESDLTDKITQYDASLEEIQKIFQGSVDQLDKTDWDALKEEDPQQWAIRRAEFTEKKEKLQALEEERKRSQEEAAVLQQKRMVEVREEQAKLLYAVKPELEDPEVFKEWGTRLIAYGQSLGFTNEELQNNVDHRVLILLDKAQQFDSNAVVKKEVAKKKQVGGKPKVLRAGTPVTRKTASKDAKRMAAKKAEFAKTGDKNLAISLLAERLKA